jgi:hypothetical protein
MPSVLRQSVSEMPSEELGTIGYINLYISEDMKITCKYLSSDDTVSYW